MLVVDANILMRAVLGKRTRTILAKYAHQVEFIAPGRFRGSAETTPRSDRAAET